MLFAAAFIWGSSFFIMKNALDAMPVQYLLAIRFTAGAALLAAARTMEADPPPGRRPRLL